MASISGAQAAGGGRKGVERGGGGGWGGWGGWAEKVPEWAAVNSNIRGLCVSKCVCVFRCECARVCACGACVNVCVFVYMSGQLIRHFRLMYEAQNNPRHVQ